MIRRSSLSGATLGALTLFPPNLGNLLDMPDGRRYLKGGVIGRAADWPDVPAPFQKYLNPLLLKSQIGAGGAWRSMAVDANGYPVVLHDDAGTFKLLRITGSSATSSGDTNAMSGGGGWPGGYANKLVIGGASWTWGVSTDFGNTEYGNGVVYSGSYSGTTASGNTSAYTGQIYAFAAADNGTYAFIVKGGSSAYFGPLSPNGRTAASTPPVNASWQAMIRTSGGNFLAIAQGSTASTLSPTGNAWTAGGALPSAAQWVALAEGAGVIVAIAQGSTAAATSANGGTTWTARALPAALNWTAVNWCAGLGLFVAVASGTASYATSPDGINWTLRAFPFAAKWQDVVWSPALGRAFACASDGSGIVMSPDGINWTIKPTLSVVQFARLEHDGVAFYATQWGQRSTSVCNPITARSTDGVNWTYFGPRYAAKLGTSGASGNETPCRSLNGRLIFLSGEGSTTTFKAHMSTDGGATWTTSTPAQNTGQVLIFGDVGFIGGLYVGLLTSAAAEATNVYFTSPDGINWTKRFLPASGLANSCCMTPNRLIVAMATSTGGTADAIYSTADGINWTAGTPNIGGFVNDGSGGTSAVVYEAARGKAFYTTASGSGWAYVSTDHGLTWTRMTNKLGAVAAPTGNSYCASQTNSNVTYTDDLGANVHIGFNHGQILVPNFGIKSPAASMGVLSVVVGGVAHVFNGQSLFSVDPVAYIDNRGAPSEATASNAYGAGFYYMLVKK